MAVATEVCNEPIWLCSAIAESQFRYGSRCAQRCWQHFPYWLEAPNWIEAKRRLFKAVNEKIIATGEASLPEPIDQWMRQACAAGKPLFCSICVPSKQFLGRSPRDDREDAIYIAIQKHVRGHNCSFPTYDEARRHRSAQSMLVEQRIANETPELTGSFEDLPDKLQRKIHRQRNGKGCWIWIDKSSWTGRMRDIPDNYGTVRFSGKNWPVHRLVYTLLCGAIPKDAIIRHQCHRKRCCNPSHLLPGTARQNTWDDLNRFRERVPFKPRTRRR